MLSGAMVDTADGKGAEENEANLDDYQLGHNTNIKPEGAIPKPVAQTNHQARSS